MSHSPVINMHPMPVQRRQSIRPTLCFKTRHMIRNHFNPGSLPLGLVSRTVFLGIYFFFSIAQAQAETGIIVRVINQNGDPVQDAVLETRERVFPETLPRGSAEMDQIDRQFVPFVLPVMVGTQVQFPNRDNIRHHVYSFSNPKPFELKLYSGRSAPPVTFEKHGVVVLGCNIHDHMIGYIYISRAPFAQTAADGLANLPYDDRKWTVWHPWIVGGQPIEKVIADSADRKGVVEIEIALDLPVQQSTKKSLLERRFKRKTPD
ncbi:MAG: methylamine utilization protein [Pseudomonadales bacterium]|nr:methylamine utilization protein [Pseudomonadales bacterium]